MLPVEVTCPECLERFEAESSDLEHQCPYCDAVFYPGEAPLGSDLEDEI
jgi:uncharacterized Zn-finger protein